MPVAVDSQLLTYNAFGLITITPKKIIVNITAVAGDHALRRSVHKELRQPLPEIAANRTVAASFGAWLEPGKRAHLTVSELTLDGTNEPLIEIPEVERLLEQAVSLIEQSAHLG